MENYRRLPGQERFTCDKKTDDGEKAESTVSFYLFNR
jgi:hypothetical protein